MSAPACRSWSRACCARATRSARSTAGSPGVYVSNHGGRALDHAISTIEVLAEVVAAVDDRAEVLVDGGFTRGTHVCKALALGARRAGSAGCSAGASQCGGAAGVARVLELLGGETRTTLGMLGCRSLADLSADHVRWSISPYDRGR